MNICAKDIITRQVVTARPEMTCKEVADLLIRHRITSAPVIDAEKGLVGMITVQDVLTAGLCIRGAQAKKSGHSLDSSLSKGAEFDINHAQGCASVYMSRDLITAFPETPVDVLAQQMYFNQVHRVIIVEPNDHQPVGVVSTFDLLKILTNPLQPDEFASRPRQVKQTVSTMQEQPTLP